MAGVIATTGWCGWHGVIAIDRWNSHGSVLFYLSLSYKGVALVVLNTEDYLKKAQDLLNQNTYRALTSDPTMRLKNKMINLLKTIKTKGRLSEDLYKKLYPTGAGSPKFYGLPKIHKPGMPLRPIVSSIGGGHLSYIQRGGQDP